MQLLLIAFLWILNLGISYWNARAVGLAWIETKAVGGWHRFMAWMGAVMAAVGFSWCFLIFLALGAHYLNYLTAYQLKISLELGYVLLVPFILFSGYAIMLDSWAQAVRSGRWQDYGIATYNTLANLHNTYDAWQSFGGAFSDVAGFFTGGGKAERDSSSSDSDDAKGAAALLVIGIVVIALSLGILTTVAIIRSYAGSRPIAKPTRMDELA